MSDRRPNPDNTSIASHVEAALAMTDDPEARFHLRQALQKLHAISWGKD